jgi:hypothetical protein
MKVRLSVILPWLLAACAVAAVLTGNIFDNVGVGGVTMAMFLQPFRLVAKPLEQLTAQSRPMMGQPEVIPWYWFDRQIYAAAGQAQLVFFGGLPATPSLGNMELAGQLPTPQFHEVYSFHFDVLAPVSNAADAAPPPGGLNDVERIRRSGTGGAGVPGGVFQFELSQKIYGQFPLSAIGPTGNPVGLLAGVDNVAAGGTPSVAQVAGWMAHFGTQAPDPIVTIPPTTAFRTRCRWDAVVPISVATFVEAGFWGALHRKVV